MNHQFITYTKKIGLKTYTVHKCIKCGTVTSPDVYTPYQNMVCNVAIRENQELLKELAK